MAMQMPVLDKNSRELFARATRITPGGVHSPVRAFKGVGGTPVFFRSAQGAMMTSVDGREYIDFCQSFGPLILGHRDPDVSEAVREAIDTALLQSPDAITARAGAQVTDATRVVSSTYPWNPSVQVNVDPYARDQQGNFLATRNEVTLTQTLELAHQPKYRRKAADASWSQQRATIAQSELTAVIAGMRAYFDALYEKSFSTRTGHSRFAFFIRRATTGVSPIARSSRSSLVPSCICMKRFLGSTTPTLISSAEIGISQNHPESARATMRMSLGRSPSSSGTPE